MKRTHPLLAWTLVCLFALSLPVAAQAEWYNPLSWGSSSSSTKKKSKEPSTLQKINSGTKDFFYKSADFLNPFNDGDDNKKSTRYTYNVGSRSSSKKQQESSWFSGWFSEPEPAPPETVSDFLDLPRAKF